MLRPAMSQIIREGESYYAFVVAVARRAREIADYWADNNMPMEKKAGHRSAGGLRFRQGAGKGSG